MGSEMCIRDRRKGQKVKALTGEVHTRPLRVKMLASFESERLTAGEIIDVLTYEGEGIYTIRLDNGVLHQANAMWCGQPESKWWVQIRARVGKHVVTGWTDKTRSFSNNNWYGH